MQYHGSLRSRELGQTSMIHVFLTPRQVLSSHPRVFIMILWESMNFYPDAGDRTADPWVTSPILSPYTTGTSCAKNLLS